MRTTNPVNKRASLSFSRVDFTYFSPPSRNGSSEININSCFRGGRWALEVCSRFGNRAKLKKVRFNVRLPVVLKVGDLEHYFPFKVPTELIQNFFVK